MMMMRLPKLPTGNNEKKNVNIVNLEVVLNNQYENQKNDHFYNKRPLSNSNILNNMPKPRKLQIFEYNFKKL